MAKVSIIVPVYNVEKYLERSIESLLNQTLEDIEIILINDGSTDNSLEICKKYQTIDKRIKIIDKENEGVSVARNIGMKYATAQYIAFIDPDDEVSPEMYENLYLNIIENKCDISICNYVRIEKNRQFAENIPLKQGRYENEEVKKILINMVWGSDLDKYPMMGSVWRSIYKKSLIEKYNITFPVNIRPMQDLIFMVEYLSKCNSMYLNENAYYYYFIRANSGVTSYKKNAWNNNKKVCELLEIILKDNNLLILSKQNMVKRWINSILDAISNETHKGNDKRLKEKFEYINFILNDQRVSTNIFFLNTENIKFTKKIILFCIKHKITIPIYIYYWIIRRIKLNY